MADVLEKWRTFGERGLIVIGGDGEGIRSLVRKKCDHLISIPIKGGVNSLNASVAGGVLLFEIVRQRNITQRQS